MGLIKILAIVFLSTAVVGGGAYLVMNNKADVQTEDAAAIETEENAEAETSGSGSFRTLLGIGKDVMCTFHSVTPGTEGTSEGTVYVSGGKMSGDFTITQSDIVFDSHMIVDGESMYSWTLSPQGTFAYMFDLDDMENDTAVSANGQNSASLDNPVDYECVPWVADASKFSIPADIDFMDTSDRERMGAGASIDAEASADIHGNASQCAACEQIPNADAKAQCKMALSCS